MNAGLGTVVGDSSGGNNNGAATNGPASGRRVRHGNNDGGSDREPNAALTETRIRTEAMGLQHLYAG